MQGESPVICVLLIDEQEMVRTGTALHLRSIDGLKVHAGVRTCREALALGLTAAPDVVVLDADGDGGDVVASIGVVRGAWRDVRIVLLLTVLRDAVLTGAPVHGVDGMVTRHDSLGTLVEAIRAAGGGRRFHSRAVWTRLVALSSRRASGEVTASASLTRRERQVLCHLGSGRTVREAASELGLSPRTVENHKNRLMGKLDVHTSIGLARYAIREGLVVP